MSSENHPPDPGGPPSTEGTASGKNVPPPLGGAWTTSGKTYVAVTKAQNECSFLAIQLTTRTYSLKDNKPSVSFTAAELQVGLDHLKHALVAKFTGGCPRIQELRQCFLSTWKPSDRCSIGALDASHILIVLENEVDARKVLSHPLRKTGLSLFRIFHWSQDFSTKWELTSTSAWVRLMNLPSQLTNLGYIEAIISSFGRFLAVDNRTRLLANPNYARVCMELDILKELPEESGSQPEWSSDSGRRSYMKIGLNIA
ncbi:hypothetical protein QQ045_014204 [Rhodiola kirilowii]